LQGIIKKAGDIFGTFAFLIYKHAAAVGNPLTGQDNLSGQNSGLIHHLIVGLFFILKAGPGEYDAQGGDNDQNKAQKKFPLK
jgi:hypothetical protein